MKGELKKYLGLMVSVFLLYLGIRYWDNLVAVLLVAKKAAAPLITGCAIAYVVNILMGFYEKKLFAKAKKKGLLRCRRPVSMILAFVSLAAILVLILILVIPELINGAKYLAETVPKWVAMMFAQMENNKFIQEHAAEVEVFLKDSLDEIGLQLAGKLKLVFSGMGNMMTSVVTVVQNIFSKLITVFLSFIFAIYILFGKERLGDQAKRLMTAYIPRQFPKVMYVVHTFDDCFHHFIVGQCTEAVILGSLCALGMTVLRLPYALMVGTFVGFTALIPVVGAYLGAGVGAFLILTESPLKALIFLIFIVVLQQVEGNVIYPRVVGNSIGLPGMWVLAAVTVGAGLLGVTGILIAVPFTASVYHLIRTDMRKRNKETVQE